MISCKVEICRSRWYFWLFWFIRNSPQFSVDCVIDIEKAEFHDETFFKDAAGRKRDIYFARRERIVRHNETLLLMVWVPVQRESVFRSFMGLMLIPFSTKLNFTFFLILLQHFAELQFGFLKEIVNRKQKSIFRMCILEYKILFEDEACRITSNSLKMWR